MFANRIVDIDIKVPKQEFENEMQLTLTKGYTSMPVTVNQVESKRGEAMYKVEINSAKCGKFTIVTKRDPNTADMIFCPMALQSLNRSFYRMDCNDDDYVGTPDDPADACFDCLSRLAIKHNGRFAGIRSNGAMEIIDDGVGKHVQHIALIDDCGGVYSCSGAKQVSFRNSNDDCTFTVNVPIGDWLSEHVDVQQAISNLPLEQKMDYLGKWLIKAKIAEEIDSEEFMDIFRQAGVIGFSEPSVLNIYKLMM